jgi:hypothetical protein
MSHKQTDSRATSRTQRRLVAGLAAVVLIALLAGLVGAQSSDKYDLSWYTLDSGSGPLVSTHYGLVGTLGESLAGRATGDQYGIGGGYDPGVPPQAYHRTYLPVVFRVYP